MTRLALKSRHGTAATGAEAMIGARAAVLDWSGGAGHVFARGERWNAVSEQPLQAGERAIITGVEGLTLHVRAEQDIR